MECCDPEGKVVFKLNGRICESLLTDILCVIKELRVGTGTYNIKFS